MYLYIYIDFISSIILTNIKLHLLYNSDAPVQHEKNLYHQYFMGNMELNV